MHRKSLEVAQYYNSESTDKVSCSKDQNGNSGGGDSDGQRPKTSETGVLESMAAAEQLSKLQRDQIHHHLQQQQQQQQQSGSFNEMDGMGDHVDEFRSNSIAVLRAKAQQHSARMHADTKPPFL